MVLPFWLKPPCCSPVFPLPPTRPAWGGVPVEGPFPRGERGIATEILRPLVYSQWAVAGTRFPPRYLYSPSDLARVVVRVTKTTPPALHLL